MTSRALRPRAPPPPPSKCAKFLYYTWKLCSVVFSHLVMISLVVAYCILGAVTFERLEADHEREVKRNISQIRRNTTASIWGMTRAAPLLNQTHWTGEVVHMLQDFENSLLREMKARGWDGAEGTDHIQWTFTGALFYSIIVITTIGYGHIAPKTQTGKVVTIFYAILGIPLMLLCLSNIGDVMASSFRFLYWRVCCYVCTRPPPRRRRRRSARRSLRARPGSARRRPRPLERAHSDTDFRYRDSGYSSGRAKRLRPPPNRTRSQPPACLPPGPGREFPREESPPRHARIDHELDDYEPDNETFPKISLPLQDLAAALQQLDEHQQRHVPQSRSKSLPRRARRDWDAEEPPPPAHDLHDVDCDNFNERRALEEREKWRARTDDGDRWRAKTADDGDRWRAKTADDGERWRTRADDGDRWRTRTDDGDRWRTRADDCDRGYDPEDEDYEFDTPRHHRTWDDRRRDRRPEYHEYSEGAPAQRRARSAAPQDWRRKPNAPQDWRREPGASQDWRREPSGAPRGRQLRRLQTIDDAPYEARYTPSPVQPEWTDEEVMPRRARPTAWSSRQLEVYPDAVEPVPKELIKPVPIWLCVLLVASYIVAGTFLFKRWEGWAYLDAAYFCFITLTTIGFGDFVPAQGRSGAGAGEAAAAAVHSIALCSLYLLFGIALLAMSFNLVQEEVRANVAALATRLGIIKPQRDSPSDSESEY